MEILVGDGVSVFASAVVGVKLWSKRLPMVKEIVVGALLLSIAMAALSL